MTDPAPTDPLSTNIKLTPEFFKAITEHSYDMIHVMDAQGKIFYVGPTVQKILGYTPDEFLAINARDYIHPEDLAMATNKFREFLQSQEKVAPAIIERIKHKDGHWVTMEVVATNLLHEPDIAGVVVNSHDITERSAFNEKLQKLVENGSDLIALADTTGRCTYISSNVGRVLGYTPDHYMSLNVFELIHPEDVPHANKVFAALLEKPGNKEKFQVRVKNKAGEWRVLDAVATNLVADPAIKSILTNFRDITGLREQEEKLRISHERFQQMAHSIDGVFWMTDASHGSILYVSPAYEKIWGRTAESLYNDPAQWLTAIHPEDRDRVLDASRTKELAGTYDEQYRIIRQPDGEIRWIWDRAYPIKDASGLVYRITGLAQDITDQKKDQEKLVRLNTAMEASREVVYITKPDGAITYVNPAFTQAYGYTLEEVIGKTPRVLKSGKQPQEYYEKLWQTITSKQVFRGELVNKSKDGSLLIMHVSASPIINASGDITGYVAIQRDVTKEKATQEALAQTKEQLEYLVANLELGVFSVDTINQKCRYVSPACSKILSVSYDELMADVNGWKKHLHPDDEARVNEGFVKLAQGQTDTYEFRVVLPDGKIRWVATFIKSTLDADHKFIKFDGTIRDVTGQKEAEANLQKRTEELERMNAGMVGRELRMIELKRELQVAKKELEQVTKGGDTT